MDKLKNCESITWEIIGLSFYVFCVNRKN